MEEKFIVVTFPDVQHLMDIPGFEDNSYLINDEKGIETYGSSAYFVSEEWYKRATQERKFVAGELVYDADKDCFGVVQHESDSDKLSLSSIDNMASICNISLLAGTETSIDEVTGVWDADKDDLYKIAEGLKGRDGNIVCYEHLPELTEYPYYSPFLDENLYGFEVDSIPHK